MSHISDEDIRSTAVVAKRHFASQVEEALASPRPGNRRDHARSIKRLAEAVGMSRAAVSRVLDPSSPSATLMSMAAIATALDMNLRISLTPKEVSVSASTTNPFHEARELLAAWTPKCTTADRRVRADQIRGVLDRHLPYRATYDLVQAVLEPAIATHNELGRRFMLSHGGQSIEQQLNDLEEEFRHLFQVRRVFEEAMLYGRP